MAAAELEIRRRERDGLWKTSRALAQFEPYQCDPVGYVTRFLGFTPWKGREGYSGQWELYDDVAASVRQQLEGQEGVVKVFRIEAGHGVGKTWSCAGLVNWFFDCFTPAVVITTAPTRDQVELLLWKDIKSQRAAAREKLPGRVLPGTPRMERGPDHFAIGRTTSDSGGQGTSRVQGQHAPHILFVIDEAEGVPSFFFDAVNAMMTGSKVMICIMIGNPKTRSSEFFRWGRRRAVKNYRFSLHHFPNVLDGADTVPGGTRREWVESMIADHCQVATDHDEAALTFTLPFEVALEDGVAHPPGTIFRPDAQYQFRVMGIAPVTDALRAFVPYGVYDAALTRRVTPDPTDIQNCRIGVDVARFGMDAGTIYVRHRALIRRAAALYRLETQDYVEAVKAAALEAAQAGASSVHVRVDGTGGFGAGIIDALRRDTELRAIPDFKVIEVHFAAQAHGGEQEREAASLITDCYAQAAHTLAGVRLENVPPELEEDLTDRLFDYVNRKGKTLKQIEPKERFRDRHLGRSPDDGDGFVLCAAPDFLFRSGAMGYPGGQIVRQVSQPLRSMGRGASAPRRSSSLIRGAGRR